MNPATGPESEPCCAVSMEPAAKARPNIRKSRVVILFSMRRAHRGHGKGVRATGEFTTGATGGQLEQDDGAGHRLVVFTPHLDDGLTRGALADVVDGAVAFHDHQVELDGRGLGRRAWRKWQGDQSGEKPRQVTHRNNPRLSLW